VSANSSAEAIVVYDDGRESGLGHRRRMEALASALEDAGVASRMTTGDAAAPLVVVDSYRWRADDRSRFRGSVVAAVDDLARDLAVDVLIDPSAPTAAVLHASAREVLAGPAYALVLRSLRELPVRGVSDDVHRVVVATGAADVEGVGAGIAAAICAATGPGTIVYLAVGPWGSRSLPHGVEAIEVKDGLGPVLAEADLVVTAGGVTLIEAMVLGRPTVAFAIAGNQIPSLDAVSAAGAAVVVDASEAAEEARLLAADTERRRALACRSSQYVDGRGADRVAARLAELLRARS
jgi:spore coat polysaccharide biosynthesis predicted glycosyltransferase SpsG